MQIICNPYIYRKRKNSPHLWHPRWLSDTYVRFYWHPRWHLSNTQRLARQKIPASHPDERPGFSGERLGFFSERLGFFWRKAGRRVCHQVPPKVPCPHPKCMLITSMLCCWVSEVRVLFPLPLYSVHRVHNRVGSRVYSSQYEQDLHFWYVSPVLVKDPCWFADLWETALCIDVKESNV